MSSQPYRIFGYEWEDICNAQQKKAGGLHRAITGDAEKPKATKDDITLLSKLGWHGIEEQELFGVLDRLSNSGLVPPDAES